MVLRVILLGLLLSGFAGAAKAGEVCNETSYVVDVAKAWRTEAGLAVEGWSRLMPGSCTVMNDGEAEEVFVYARSTPAYLGGVREWRGDQPACVDTADFAIEGVGDCASLGLETRYFRQLSEEERTRSTLIELADFRDRADEAGLQRLLQAAGYDVRMVDGYEGRRTRSQVNAFESDIDRRFGSNRSDLIAALHAAAIERNENAGLRVCNDAENVMAIAVARANGRDYQVSGWWQIEPGGCAKAVSARLTAGELFYHARLVDTESLRVNGDGDRDFCIAPSRFVTDQNDACEDTGLITASFVRAPDPLDGAIELRLDETNFVDVAP
jgi:uncharacterized membrane protein